MGYEAPTSGQKLDFTGTQYEGLEVTADTVPLGMMIDVMAAYAEFTAADGADVAKVAPAFGLLTEQFASVLEDWNVTRKGQPVPATLEGLRSLDFTFGLAIITAWITGTAQAPPPLPAGSPSGGISQEALAQMAGLSSSLPSSRAPS